jgi:hypothetical protein
MQDDEGAIVVVKSQVPTSKSQIPTGNPKYMVAPFDLWDLGFGIWDFYNVTACPIHIR